MKKLLYTTCLAIACYAAPHPASAQPADALPDVAAAGAGNDASEGVAPSASDTPPGETYLPGPGGGEIDRNGGPILESTGLEDGPGGCKCSSAIGAPVNSFAPTFALLASLALLRRRGLRS
jgi:hypothetical protein